MRYLSADNRWVSTEEPRIADTIGPNPETLVDAGLLHPSMLASGWDLMTDGIPPWGGLVRLTDAPGGKPRFASYRDVLETNPWGHGTIHTIARGLARLPLKLYEPDPADDAEPGTVAKIVNPNRKDEAGRIAWALRYPNPSPHKNAPRSRRSLGYATVIAKLVHGNGLWEIRRDRDGILGFTFIPWEQVEMDQDALVYKIHSANYGHPVITLDIGERTNKPPERVLHPRDVVHFGLWEGGQRPLTPSPVRSLHVTVALYDAVSRHMLAYFKNGARLSGHLKVEPGLTERAKEAIRQEIYKLYADPANTGKVLVSSAEWQAFHREPQFDQIVNLIKHSRDEIFVTYGVPPPVMGVIERAIMSNVREMRDQYYRDLIGPHAELMAGDFESQVVDTEPTLVDRQIFAEFDVDEQLRPDLWKRAASFRNLMLGYTPNELRRIERQPALKGDQDPNGYANTLQRPLNESPLTNMPDYGLRDRVQAERVEVERERVQVEREARLAQAAANSGNNSGVDEERRAQLERQAQAEDRRLSIEEQRLEHQREVDLRRVSAEEQRVALEATRIERDADRQDRGVDIQQQQVDRVQVPRVDLEERRVVLEEKKFERGDGAPAPAPEEGDDAPDDQPDEVPEQGPPADEDVPDEQPPAEDEPEEDDAGED